MRATLSSLATPFRLRASRFATFAVPLVALVSCGDSPASPPLPGNGEPVVENGTLFVRGNDAANEIELTVSAGGVEIERDGVSTFISEPVTAIDIDAGGGNNVIRYRQSAVADMSLTIEAGGGADRVEIDVEPAGAGDQMTLLANIDVGGGGDQLDFRWNSTAIPALNAYLGLQVDGSLPEVGDEVIVAFEHGDPDQPYITGMVWNSGGGDASSPPVGGANLALELDFTPGTVDVDLRLVGGPGPDDVEFNADYSNILLQQGIVGLEVDLGEGDNGFSSNIDASAGQVDVVQEIRGGDGQNRVELEDVLGDRGARVYLVELGDGDGQTTIRFGDGRHGQNPSGESSIKVTYRGGSGDDTIEVHGDLEGPIEAEFTFDFGGGQNDVVKRYKFLDAWPTGSGSAPHIVPSQTKVIVMGDGENDLDLQLELPSSAVGASAVAPGEIAILASGFNEGSFEFIRLPAEHSTPSLEPAGGTVLYMHDVLTSGATSVVMDAAGDGSTLVFRQERVELAPGAALDVQLRGRGGDDAMFADIADLSGPGFFTFLAEGGAGRDFLAVLTRDLEPGAGGEMSFDVRGGDGDDVLALAFPPDMERHPSILHRIVAESGSNICYAPLGVLLEDCERESESAADLLLMLNERFGKEYEDIWNNAV